MKWYKNKRISMKLIIGFLVVAFIAVIVGTVGVINLTTMEKASTELYQQNGLGLQNTGNAATTFQRVRFNTLKLSTYTNDTDIANGITYVDEIKVEMNAILDELDTIIYSTEGKAHLATIKTEWGNYQKAADELTTNVQAHEYVQAMIVLNDKLGPIGSTIRDTFTALLDVVSTNAELKATNNTELASSSILIMICVAVAGVLISVILGIYISRMISNPINNMVEVAKQLAKGDVEANIKVDTKDEIGTLAKSFEELIASTKEQAIIAQRIAEGDLTAEINVRSDKDLLGKGISELLSKLNHIMETIVMASEQVASGSNLVSDSSMALSQGSTEQASSVEELTASLQEISAQVIQNAENAKSASDLARSAETNAIAGNGQMKDLLVAMDDINDSSSSINKIIKVIDDIAFQTNILALNAAVEAARAGQHGKGFAVVAEEVRNLAAKSASAAKDTTELIESSIKKVEVGTKIANGTASALNQIVEQVKKASDLVSEISTASSEQSSGIEQINQGIVQISQVVQSNAATSEESAAASEELSSQAAQLKEIVSIFRLKRDVVATNYAAAGRGTINKESHPALPVKRASISIGNENYGKY